MKKKKIIRITISIILLFVVTLAAFFVFNSKAVDASNYHFLQLSSTPLLYANKTGSDNNYTTVSPKVTGEYTGGQSMAMSYDGSYAYIFISNKNTDVNAMLVYQKQGSTYKRIYVNENLNCGHSNGSTYYESGGERHVVVATNREDPIIVDYTVNDNGKITATLNKNPGTTGVVSGITYDKSANKFYALHSGEHGKEIISLNSSLSSPTVIRSKTLANASSTGGTPGYIRGNQDITVHGDYLYVVSYNASASDFDSIISNSGINTNIGIKDSFISVFNKKTGDFVKYLFIAEDVVLNATAPHSDVNMVEIEDLEFINDTPYFYYQAHSSFQVLPIKSSSIENFNLTNKLKIRYHMNGGYLYSAHGANYSSSGSIITYQGNDSIEVGEVGGKLGNNGLLDYNNTTSVNIAKTGYKAVKDAEWSTSPSGGGITFNQSKVYKISELADVSNNNATLTLYVNWTPIQYSVIFNSGYGPSVNRTVRYGESITLSNQGFSKPGYKLTRWNSTVGTFSVGQTVYNISTTDGEQITMDAVWEPINYQILFNSGYGQTSYRTVRYDESVTMSNPGFTRPGYKLVGWNSTVGSFNVGQVVRNLTVNDGQVIQVTAIWEPIQYSVIFNSGYGPSVNRTVRYGESIVLSNPGFNKTGYKLYKWTSNNGTYGLNQTVSNLTVNEGQTIRLNAAWEPITYHVVLEPNGGTCGRVYLDARYDTPVTLSSTCSRSGFVFLGWSRSPSGGEIYQTGSQVRNLTSVEGQTIPLYAQWSAGTYSIHYNLNGGTVPQGNPYSYDINTPTFRLNNPIKTGYTFIGWTGTGISTPKMEVVIYKGSTGNKEYYANYQVNHYTIKYNANGGDGSVSSQSANYGQSITIQNNGFTRSGYNFNRWNTKEDGTGQNYSPGQTVSNLSTANGATVNLYAIWDQGTFSISYNLDGGQLEQPNPTSYETTSGEITLNNPTKVGYDFIGWTGSNGNTPELQVKIPTGSTGNKNYKANYKAHVYTVHFDANGGEGDQIEDQQFTYDETGTLNENPYTRVGYIFKEWNTKFDGTGTSYKNLAEVKNLTVEEGFVLYAIWMIDENYHEIQDPPAVEGEAPAASQQENPETGYFISGLVLLGMIGIGITLYRVSKKTKIHKV